MKVLKFSHLYTKIDDLQSGQTITTIRRRLKGIQINDCIYVKLNNRYLCIAKIVKIEKKKLKDISTDLLKKDTDKKTRQEAVQLLNSFYRNKITEDEELFIFYLKKKDVFII
ncbi:MAG: ASCH domain-containing protein [Candidatus Heimdallarchaeum endolithica]|uniref:ASCH domain-containing protein n=1 Tax=Candidatus Heimdallarchaeum endolithica TaxID=2876572 RepID=A0A9Y1BR07_9ARCH|nr:MAG: ASCH domain-containing protein [Candidatus Heimdallarchaeum endolithica]